MQEMTSADQLIAFLQRGGGVMGAMFVIGLFLLVLIAHSRK